MIRAFLFFKTSEISENPSFLPVNPRFLKKSPEMSEEFAPDVYSSRGQTVPSESLCFLLDFFHRAGLSRSLFGNSSRIYFENSFKIDYRTVPVTKNVIKKKTVSPSHLSNES